MKMRSKQIPYKCAYAWAFGIALIFASGTNAQVPLPTMTPPAPATNPDLPEYRAKSLPTDTFKPSEKVSEDYPVAFPADI